MHAHISPRSMQTRRRADPRGNSGTEDFLGVTKREMLSSTEVGPCAHTPGGSSL